MFIHSLRDIECDHIEIFYLSCDILNVFYSNLRMVDIDEFHARLESMELSVFQNLCMRHIDAAKDKLLKK